MEQSLILRPAIPIALPGSTTTIILAIVTGMWVSQHFFATSTATIITTTDLLSISQPYNGVEYTSCLTENQIVDVLGSGRSNVREFVSWLGYI